MFFVVQKRGTAVPHQNNLVTNNKTIYKPKTINNPFIYHYFFR